MKGRHIVYLMSTAWGMLGILHSVFADNRSDHQPVHIFAFADGQDSILREEPVQWALATLETALQDRLLDAVVSYNLSEIDEPAALRLIICPGTSDLVQGLSAQANVVMPTTAESLALFQGSFKDQKVLVASGADTRGLVYAILELADRVIYSDKPVETLKATRNTVEQPANAIRSIMRLFVSEVEDKSWFYDKDFWKAYLSMLASNRFNRFSLTLGLGYDAPKEVVDSYFIFAYPYLVTVPGYDVQVNELATGERERNLEMLKFISREAARRGLHFQLGLWGHAYECIDSPDVNYTISGLNPDNHAEYCLNAVRTLLEECPDIDGITFRAHYESGIPDGSKGFWETVFQGVAECGRPVEIDLHAKGISYDQINLALATGQAVIVSPKLTAEHLGLPAHQAAIREIERVPSPNDENPRNKVARYGYADFLSDQREYGILHRVWPGKQKLFLWGDPELAAGYGRYAGFCGTQGLEVCEPLCFKGRQGSGAYPDRRIYADASLVPEGGDWKKYLYNYRMWGRFLYDPDVDPEAYRRLLRNDYGDAAYFVEQAMSQASKILPLITSAHMPAISAMAYWPEMYTNMFITNGEVPQHFRGSYLEKRFGWAGPLDPAIFSPINEFVDDLLDGVPSARYSALDVACWLETFAANALEQLEIAEKKSADPDSPAFRRMQVDVRAQCQIGLFFAEKLRAATSFMIFEKTGRRDSLNDAVYFYRRARDSWNQLIAHTEGIYVEDLGFGHFPRLRGHWKDRLPAIEADLLVMERLLINETGAKKAVPELALSPTASAWLTLRPERPVCIHQQPANFHPGQPLELQIDVPYATVKSVKLHYRHVNQVEAYTIETMVHQDGNWRTTIPADFTDSDYALMYFFEIIGHDGNAWLFPGYRDDLANQPYFHLMR